jgi:hypothetical protein
MTHMDPGGYPRPTAATFGLRLAVALLAMAVGATAFLLWQQQARKTSASTPPTSEVPPEVVTPPIALVTITSLSQEQPSTVPSIVKPMQTVATHSSRPDGARAIDVTSTIRGAGVDAAAVRRELARLRPELDACYAAPECSRSSSPWCISSDVEKKLEWRLFISPESGKVNESQHSGGGMQLGSCVGHTLDKLRLAPYTWERTRGEMGQVDVVISIQ